VDGEREGVSEQVEGDDSQDVFGVRERATGAGCSLPVLEEKEQ
jgi:hypothetical protein